MGYEGSLQLAVRTWQAIVPTFWDESKRCNCPSARQPLFEPRFANFVCDCLSFPPPLLGRLRRQLQYNNMPVQGHAFEINMGLVGADMQVF
jgi:hypothetical protein